MQGESAHLRHAWKQLRKQSGGAAKFGSAWREAAGLDQGKRLRRAFVRMLSYATAMGTMYASMAFWRNAELKSAICGWRQTVADRLRMLQLLRRSLSHHSSVLLQALIKESNPHLSPLTSHLSPLTSHLSPTPSPSPSPLPSASASPPHPHPLTHTHTLTLTLAVTVAPGDR